ncbi:hypothetical protein LY78DRAFT_435191 [Colletotrichum sublineola]|uniref:Putative conidial yellow pigment biosynthesis polyketide synthase n=1 Tax=Colletotrichum sublineola TaxID=1173701 RepID=A0A066XJX9_COLSU|nr:hypothetical protein LY78DRAFT_435191 [Colletotrichum sublineola]KDN67984.1 putative conidial yellow pigment biosynthesis polyketide synthase [Colletotrichum sublineola]
MPHALHPRLPPLAELCITIPSAKRVFASAPGRPRRILLNNVDMAGSNAGMSRKPYHAIPVFRDMVDRCARLCAEDGFPPFVDIIVDAAGRQGDHVDTDDIGYTMLKSHPALVTLELALAAFWRHVGVEPAMVIGYSPSRSPLTRSRLS